MKTFQELDLPSSVQKALVAMEFSTPTPIQAQAIPVALERKDVIGVAQTGTGKTAAFCLPMLTSLMENPNKTGLVLVPTRELALQIEEFWKKISQFSPGMHAVLLIGGVAMQPQIRGLQRKPRVIIATPGRLVDHLQRRTADVRNTEILVLDEADRMLDMGFAPQLNQIVRMIPTDRQTLFFTATWSKEMDALAKKYLIQPVRVTVGTVSAAAPKVDQSVLMTSVKNKNDTLLDEINAREGSVLVFARTQSRTDRVAKFLHSYGVDVGRIHGGRSQAQRVNALESFRAGKIRVLIATDIAARGIDVTDIGHVINYDLPQVPEDYIHRIGRTGRNGATGQSISFVTSEDRAQWLAIDRLLKRGGTQVTTAKEIVRDPSAPAPVRVTPPAPVRVGSGGGNSNGGGRSGGNRGGNSRRDRNDRGQTQQNDQPWSEQNRQSRRPHRKGQRPANMSAPAATTGVVTWESVRPNPIRIGVAK